MIRLGIGGRLLGMGQGDQAQRTRPLSIRLLELRERLVYLAAQRIGCYRLPSDLLAAEPLPHAVAAEVGGLAQAHGIRLTLHLGLRAALGAADDRVAAQAIDEAGRGAALLAALGTADGVLVAHIGGTQDDLAATRHRFVTRYERLPALVRQYLAVEPDEDCADLTVALKLHQQTGVPVVLDTLHQQMHNPHGIAFSVALGLALATWPTGRRPKVHLSSQRTEAHVLRERGRLRLVAPHLGQHSDYLNPHEAIAVLRAARGLPVFDLMLEAKAGDLALFRLREDLRRYAVELAERVN